MGNCRSLIPCCRTQNNEVEDVSEETRLLQEGRGRDLYQRASVSDSTSGVEEGSGDYAWEEGLVKKMMRKGKKVSWSNVAIVSFNDGTLRASAPPGFTPDQQGVKSVIQALNGDTKGLDSNGINLGNGIPVSAVGKLQEGKAIYGGDGRGGGCIVHKTRECVLIVVYSGDAAPATRLASEVAEYIIDKGR